MARSKLKKRQARGEEKSSGLSESLATISDPTGGVSEDYRGLRTNLFYALVDTPPKVISITSPGPAEGKSTTCANLAVVLAQADKSTLVMDCDLRKPTMHMIFGLRNFHGVSDALIGERDLTEIWQEPLPGLKVVTSGTIPPNPAELVGSKRFAQLIGQVREDFDYVLMDTPPTELVSDAMVLATQGEGVLLVFDAQSTRKDALRKAVRDLETVGARVLGTVINNMKSRKGDYYYYYGSTYGEGSGG